MMGPTQATNAIGIGVIGISAAIGAGATAYGIGEAQESHPNDPGVRLASTIGVPMLGATLVGTTLASASSSPVGFAASGGALLGLLGGVFASALTD